MNSELEEGIVLPLMEAFYTIQGEGFYTGSSAYFLRIGGCDVGCHWCDVKESWDVEKHTTTKVEEMIFPILEYPTDTVVVTGGEPLMWNMSYLTRSLKIKGFKTHLETSGSHKLTGKWDWICLSPKKFQKPMETIKPLANELKIIVKNKSDFKWAEQQRVGVSEKCKLYLQPEWSNKEDMIPLIIDYVMLNPEWQISLQTHKYLHIP
ncbi:MAG: 7-carboxy-7-deazaguanine synthase QueE [Flavobacteriales bacterium]|nr:7-carboxy-7-deazaguanine synthase QueE [Flavobacteriales bacterium]|tara:strand:+ start:977 stop:1597 length:621 start_codon:yes stop_codon:yes gene_type:complete